MTAHQGVLLQMQSFSVHDGDGIRTVIFLPGCPLRCRWCANPETWTADPKLAFYGVKCKQCGACRSVCPKGIYPPFDSGGKCTGCGLCAARCPQGALVVLCQPASVGDIIRRIARDEVFYRFSGGGVTFSGGEPTMQHAFLRGLVMALGARGVDLWIETCGYFDWDTVKDLFHSFNHVFLDIKHMDDAQHRRWTGQGNSLILRNAKLLAATGVPLTVRIPCVKGANFTEENLLGTARFMREHMPCADLELLPYHTLGREKYLAMRLGGYEEFGTPTSGEMEQAGFVIEEAGVRIVSYQ